MPTNNIVLNPQRGDSFALTAVAASVISARTSYGVVGSAVYTGTITGGANNGLANQALTISGFTNASNNGTFTVLFSTATTILLNNAYAVAETHAATASYTTNGTPSQYASKIANLWSNQTGDNVLVNANAGDCLIAIAFGLRQPVNFDLLHGSAPYTPPYPPYSNAPVAAGTGTPSFALGQLAGLNDFNAAPTISDLADGVPQDIIATSITSNVLTVTLENTGQAALSTGQTVVLQGTQESFLNGQTVTVLSGATATQFTANFTHANYSNADDTGTATPNGNAWTLEAFVAIADSDYTVSYPFSGPPSNGSVTPATFSGQLTISGGKVYAYGSNLATSLTASSPFPSSMWSIDGYYPSMYIWVAPNVAAGTYKVNLNSMFQPGINVPADWSGGSVPIFDGGVNFMVINVSGAAASSPVDAVSISTTETTSNPATAPAALVTTAADGDMLLSIGLMKSGNAFAPGTVNVTAGAASGAAMTQIGNGTLVGSEAHYLVEYALTAAGSAGSFNPNFSNPLGYPVLVGSIAIKSS
jgi:hypothetical protein